MEHHNHTILIVLVATLLVAGAIPLSTQPITITVDGLTGQSVSAIALDPHNTSIVYAGTREGVFKSADGGLSWSASNGSPTWITALAVHPKNSSTIYATAYNDYDDGVFRSVDAGLSW